MPLQSQLAMSHEAIPLELLTTVSPTLLCRFLRLFGPAAGAYCHAIYVNTPTGVAALYADLNSAIASLPAALHRVLAAISDLATESGREEILSAATARGETVLCDVANHVELAFRAYLDHSLVFDTAYARAASRATRRYKIFTLAGGRIDWGAAAEMRTRLLDIVHGWLEVLGISAVCDIRLHEPSAQVSLLVLYNRRSSASGLTSTELDASPGSLPTSHALITYHAKYGLLCVRAELFAEQHAYRRMFGQALFGDDDRFRETTVFTGDPLVERGIEALSVDGVCGMDRTVLRGVGVEYLDDRARSTVQYTATNLAMTLATRDFQANLARGTICSMSMAMMLAGYLRPIFAEIIPPSDLTMNGPVGRAMVICGFLVARGFMLVDPQSVNSQAA